jgi:hypothetical protein
MTNLTVVVTNTSGAVTSAVVALMVRDPFIRVQPLSQTVTPGYDATFSATAAGTTPLAYQWRKNNQPLSDSAHIIGSQSNTLTLLNVTTTDAGSYFLVVTNSYGSTNSVTAALVVKSLVITSQPVSATKDYLQTNTFSVGVMGAQPIGYQWRKNGVGLSDGGPVSGATNSSLTLAGVGCSDNGSYTVVVTNASMTLTSAVATLTVNDPVILAQPLSRTNAAGQTATFTVSAVGSPPLSYQWSRGSVPLTNTTSATLVLNQVAQADAGAYSVTVSNACSTVTSSTASLTVVDLPVLTREPASRTNGAGDNAVFDAFATGQSVTYQWRFNGTNVSGAITSRYTRHTVTNTDAGTYTVVVSNLAGPVSSTGAVLTVLGADATKLAQWNFNGTTNPSTGQGTARLVGGVTATFNLGTLSDPAPTNNTAWNSAGYPAQLTGNRSAGVEFAVSTAGYQDVLLTWEERHSPTASKYTRLLYRSNGTNYIVGVGFTNPVSDNFVYYMADLSGAPGVADNPNFAFRLVSEFESSALGGTNDNYAATLTGQNYGSSGTIRFDQVTVFAQPFSPALNIQFISASSNVLISWPLPADGWVLESTNRVDAVSAPWPPIAPPYQTNAAQAWVILPATADDRFYRLHKP